MTQPSTAPSSTPKASTKPPYPRRFTWVGWIFTCFLLFDMIFRSCSVMFPWQDWATELDMRTMPVRLPTLEEIEKLRAIQKPDEPNLVTEEFMLAADSVWMFFRPWPEPSVRAKFRTGEDIGKWGIAWVTSRLEFFENVVGINEEWPMFSPSVGRRRWVSRGRLEYEDGSTRIIRNRGDPEDLTNFSHWNKEKILDHELKVQQGKGRWAESLGYCNLLSHRYATNDNGSALKKIYLFMVYYDPVPPGEFIPFRRDGKPWHVPGENAYEWYKAQTGPPAKQVYPDFYVYDVKTREGIVLVDKYE